MAPNLLAISGIGLLLGFRHAFEPDHLAAVSTLATRPGARLWSAARLGLVWGIGHTATVGDRKSTRLNSSHLVISYAVFCLKKKKTAGRSGTAVAPFRPQPHRCFASARQF